MTARDTDWDGVRLHVVTGKGGTGKTTVAASLALALAGAGKKVLLIEVEGRQGLARLFDVPQLPYAERKIAAGVGGGDVYALALDPEGALLDYLEMFYNLRRMGKTLTKIGVVDFATTIAPGLSDVLVTGKATEAARRRRGDKHVYDHVVMDAPPTGRISRFLNINTEVAGLARFGPIFTQSQAVMRVIQSPETVVHLVTLLEEMPVQETVDGVAELRAAGLPVGAVFVNMVRPPVLDEAAVLAAEGDHAEELALALADAGVGARPNRNGTRKTVPAATRKLVEPLLAQGREHAARVLLEREQRADVQALKLPTYELPLLSGGVDLGGLYRLAAALKEQGAA
jgi:anion-transporting  ArsA/GET3 family ATPase